MRQQFIALALLLGVAACSTTTSRGVTTTVDAAVVGLSTAETLALIYTKLPRCIVPKTSMLCSDAGIVRKLKDLDMVAYNAVKAAEKNEALISTAIDAVAALQTAIPRITN